MSARVRRSVARLLQLGLLALLLLLPAPGHAQVRRAFFSNVVPGGGIRYDQNDFQALPAEVKTFDPGKDQNVVFIVVLTTPEPTRLQAVLKNPDGKRHAGFDQTLARWGRVVTSQNFWRSFHWRWPTDRMAGKSGAWTLELTVDDKPAGTYTFTLK